MYICIYVYIQSCERMHTSTHEYAVLRAKPGNYKKPHVGAEGLDGLFWTLESVPEGPSTQYLRLLAPKTIPLVVLGTRDLKYWVLGPSGCGVSLNFGLLQLEPVWLCGMTWS